MDEKIKQTIVQRHKYNRLIIDELISIINEHPELRFRQILTILNLDNDGFYEESVTTYQKLLQRDKLTSGED